MATPATVTAVKIEETDFDVVFEYTGSFVDTQETAVQKVDASTLTGALSVPTLSIKRAQWSCTGSGRIAVLFDASTKVTALQLGGLVGDQHYSPYIPNTAGTGVSGDILFTTTGFGSGDTYNVILTFSKDRSGFSTAPTVTTLTINDSKSGTYLTGDTFSVLATFSQAVNLYETQGYIELVLTTGTVRAYVDKTNPVVSSHATGPNTLYAVFNYTFQAGDGALATGFTLGNISGIYGTKVGQLNVIDSLPSLSGITAFTVNKAIVSSATTTNGTHYITGGHIDVTVNYNITVVVTGTPQIPLTITSGNKNASYISGSGTNTLLFRYTPVVSGDVTVAGTFAVGSPISLNSGTINRNGLAATLTFTPPTTTTVAIN